MKGFLKLLLCCLLLLVAGLALFHAGVRINLTASMPRGLYLLVPGNPWRGDVVSFCLDDPFYAGLAQERGYLRSGACPGGLEPLLKTLAGVPGDSLEISPEGVWVDGHLEPNSRLVISDSHGRPMPVSTSLGFERIPSGMGLVLSSDHPGGFDGRYFGLQPLASLHLARLVFTF
ncbi:MAG: conjugative transfer signal peptidase TraF [Desulfovibrionaceae bacterium]|nr:conjugative transfer signal peptidase TraF [Desulfovibrionaceae bacterium]MBF0515101.1 conjugative transfer signal peptidase TraF [Desulfovibrionaceae bacterium]